MEEECVSDLDKTIFFVGKSGSGKSATVNSIIEGNVLGKVTSLNPAITSHSTILDDGQILTVIDTSGSFDISSIEPETLGIHAVVVVLSLRNRYSEEESVVIESLKLFFGAKLMDYMIVVFTHGDALEDMTLDYYLAHMCPQQLTRILEGCGNRFVMFDNMTEDKLKKYQQREELLRLVDEVVANNGGVPYTDKLFVEHKEGEWELIDEHSEDESSENGSEFNEVFEDCLLLKLKESMHHEMSLRLEKQSEDEYSDESSDSGSDFFTKACADRSREMEPKHREMTLRLEKLLEYERAARMQAEADAQSAKTEKTLIQEKMDDDNQSKIEAKLLETTLRLENQLAEKFAQMQTEYKAQEAQRKLNDEQKIESKLRETTLKLENQLADIFAQMQAEFKAQEALRKKSNDAMRKLREDMESAQRYTENTFTKIQLWMDDERPVKNNCSVFANTSSIRSQQLIIRDKIRDLEKMLEHEQVARMLAEAKTVEVQKKLNEEISKLRDDLGKPQSDIENLRKNIWTDSASKTETSSSWNGLPITTYRQKKKLLTPIENPFGVFNTETAFVRSPQPLQPRSDAFFGGFSRDQAGFGLNAQIEGGKQARGSVFVPFGQSRTGGDAADALETWFGGDFASFGSGGGDGGGDFSNSYKC